MQDELAAIDTGPLEQLTTLKAEIEKLGDNKLAEVFAQDKYGTYFRNLMGVIEHAHYHLGQIVIIKKMIGDQKK